MTDQPEKAGNVVYAHEVYDPERAIAEIERLRVQRDELLAALRHVADMTHIDTDLEWHFKRGYDPKRVLSVIAAVEEKP